jgi:hypothetical protein
MKTNQNITAALAPTRDAIIREVEQTLNRAIAKVYENLENHGWDLRLACPVNYNSYSCNADKAAKAFAKQFTAAPEGWSSSCMPKAPEPRVRLSDEVLEAKVNAAAVAHADMMLASYAAKLTAKAAQFGEGREIESCVYSGTSNPWAASTMSVTFTDGHAIKLTTRIILNCSCLGKLFNQFPTRLAK